MKKEYFAGLEITGWHVGEYPFGGNQAWQMLTETELDDGRVFTEPLATVTVNPSGRIGKDEIAVKNYSENEGMLEFLIENGYVAEPHRVIVSGFVEIPVCKVLKKPRHTEPKEWKS